TVSFQETASGGTLDWHDAPTRQLVITLSGTLDFETRSGHHFMLKPGDILLAEDTAGGGHRWKLVDDHPWRRVYVVLAAGASAPCSTPRNHTKLNQPPPPNRPKTAPPEGRTTMNKGPAAETDIVLVGAGIMSATLAVFLKELEPSLRIEIFEMLEGAALE